MVYAETDYMSLNKYKEELCGDRVEVIRGGDGTVTMVLADGLGSGVKASILATLTAKIIGTMTAEGMQIEDAVATIAQTLPVCSVRHIAYSTFSIIKTGTDGSASLFQFDNPTAIFMRGGECRDYPAQKREVYGKSIYESRFFLQPGDMILLISDGVVHAGLGTVFNFGWQLPQVKDFVQQCAVSPGLTARAMAFRLCNACQDLYGGRPGDDTTVAVMRIREEEAVTVMVGPPRDKVDDRRLVELFLSQPGKKVICGGTTSQIVGRFLGEKVETRISDYVDRAVPPIGYLKGIDLVTEGVLTIEHAVELLEKSPARELEEHRFTGRDGASLLLRLLTEEATRVDFLVGRAVNPAHQNPAMPIGLNIKQRLVEKLAQYLQNSGKQVNIRYF